MSIKSLVGPKDGDAGNETPQGDAGTANDAEGGEGEEEHDLDWWKAQARKHERNAKAKFDYQPECHCSKKACPQSQPEASLTTN